MARRLPSPESVVDNMVAGAQRATQKWLDNTLNPSRDPVEAAIAANGRYKAEMQAAISEDRWVKGLQSTDKAAMRSAIQNSSGAYASGVASRRDKTLARIRVWQPLQQSVIDKVDGMPKDTLEQRMQRMVANAMGNYEAGKTLMGVTSGRPGR